MKWICFFLNWDPCANPRRTTSQSRGHDFAAMVGVRKNDQKKTLRLAVKNNGFGLYLIFVDKQSLQRPVSEFPLWRKPFTVVTPKSSRNVFSIFSEGYCFCSYFPFFSDNLQFVLCVSPGLWFQKPNPPGSVDHSLKCASAGWSLVKIVPNHSNRKNVRQVHSYS